MPQYIHPLPAGDTRGIPLFRMDIESTYLPLSLFYLCSSQHPPTMSYSLREEVRDETSYFKIVQNV